MNKRRPYETADTLVYDPIASNRNATRASLHSLGFRIVRVRYHGDVARLEVDSSEMMRIFEPQIREIVEREFRKIGFRFVAADLKGFRSGSLNEGIAQGSGRENS